MPLRRRRPSLERALRYVRSLAGVCRDKGVNALPSAVSMAAGAGVSPVTMLRALQVLSDEQVVVVIPRKGVYLRERVRAEGMDVPTPVPTPEPALLTGHARVADIIRRDILSHRYGPGERLPSYKILATSYQASYRTLRRALVDLHQEGLLCPLGRGYSVSTVTARHNRSRIVVIAATDNMAVVGNYSPRSPDFWRILARECHRHGVGVDLYGLMKAMGTAPWSDGRRRNLLSVDRDSPVLGYLVLTLGMDARRLDDLLRMLDETGRPVSIVHENAHRSMAEIAAAVHTRRTRVCETAATDRCGREAGRFLIRHGHRRAAVFFSPRQDARWRKRYDGIAAAYSEAGMPGAVEPFCPAGIDTDRDFARATSPGRATPLLEELSRYASDLYAPVESQYESWMRPGVGVRSLRSVLLPRLMLPVFEAARRRPEITAWVGACDEFALLALSYLRHNAVDVPGRVSVIGFDNSLHAIGLGLSSYDFNTLALVQHALRHVLEFPEGPGARQPGVMEVPGSLFERGSSGPVESATRICSGLRTKRNPPSSAG